MLRGVIDQGMSTMLNFFPLK